MSAIYYHDPQHTGSSLLKKKAHSKGLDGTYLPYTLHCAHVIRHSRQKTCGWIWIGMLNFCTMAYTPNGTPHWDQQSIITAGSPSVRFVRWFRHICGTSWTHHSLLWRGLRLVG